MPIGCAQAFGTLQQQSLDISVQWHLFSRSDSFAFHLSSSQLFSISTQLIFIPYHLISSHVVSSQLSSPHLISSHVFSPFLSSSQWSQRIILIFSHVIWAFLISSAHLSSSLFSSSQLLHSTQLVSAQLFSAHSQIISILFWPKTCSNTRSRR